MPKYIPKDIPENYNVSSGSPLKNFFQLAAVVSLVVGAMYLLLGWSSSYLANKISYKREHQIGSFIFSAKIKKSKSKFDAKELQYFNQLANSLWQPFDRERDIKIIVGIDASKQQNAFMGPGGFMMLTKGLIDSATSENELAFIICHELGHFEHRHVLEGMGRSLAIGVLAAIIDPNNQMSFLRSGVNFTELSYGRGKELEADVFGLQCLQKKYGHIKGYDQFFSRMGKIEHKLPGKAFFKYMSTHPLSEERINKLKNLGQQNGFDFDGEITVVPQYIKD